MWLLHNYHIYSDRSCKILHQLFTLKAKVQLTHIVRGSALRTGVMFMCAHVYDEALGNNTVSNVPLGLRLVGHGQPCPK